jgi:quercetin dioxygenase-like cupin family protein
MLPFALFCTAFDVQAEEVSMDIKVAQPLSYTRIYSDSAGESHFADEALSFNLIDFAPPAPPISVTDAWGAEGVVIISSPSGWYGDWHPTPRRQLTFVLKGLLEVEVSDGEMRKFGPGSVALVEDTVGKGHRSRVIGDERVFIAAVSLAELRSEESK